MSSPLARLGRSATFRFAVAITAVFFLIVISVGQLAQAGLISAFETQASVRLKATAEELVHEYLHGGYDELEEAVRPRLQAGQPRLRYALVTESGSLKIGDQDLAPLLPMMHAWMGDGPRVIERSDRSPHQSAVLTTKIGDDLTLLLVDDLAAVDEVRRVVSGALWNAMLITGALGGLAGLLLSRYLLKQVKSITRTAEAIIAGDLTSRIPVGASNDEFDRLRSTLNRMLDKIASLLANVHQVSTDIAHDLRTPLSRLRHRLERARTDVDDRATFRVVIDKTIEDIDGVLDTFSGLLRIAQIESGRQRAAFRRLDLSDVVTAVCDVYDVVADEGGRSLSSAVTPGIWIEGDRELLTQMLSNLVENALTHTVVGTSISVSLETDDRTAHVTIIDNGTGISLSDRPFVFRRFYRGERSRSTPGNGLGLSLAAAVAELHGSTIELSDNRPGLRASIELPLSSAAAEQGASPEPHRPTDFSGVRATAGDVLILPSVRDTSDTLLAGKDGV